MQRNGGTNFYWACGALVLLTVLGVGLAFVGQPRPLGEVERPYRLKAMIASDATDLVDRLSRHGLAETAAAPKADGIPRVGLLGFPTDWPGELDLDNRKAAFIAGALPLVLAANERLEAVRSRMLAIAAAGDKASRRDRAWLAALAARYGTVPDQIDELKRRVDIVPASLALAQAAVESGWGTSRFARTGNALFGQWTWDTSKGIRPEGMRDLGRDYAVRRFDRLYGSVAHYMLNLNTAAAYEEFRKRRAATRAAGKAPNGQALAATLDRYSEKREEYVQTLRTVIRANGLDRFDRSRLRP